MLYSKQRIGLLFLWERRNGYESNIRDRFPRARPKKYYIGTQLHIVDPTKERDPAALRFAQNVAKALQTTTACSQSVSAYVLKTYMNYVNAACTEAKGFWRTSMEIAQGIVDEFVARRDKGELAAREQDSYLDQALIPSR